MKFLCERCKTRYSIGDDRVRGKILKIRCKNCANVITVREGMGDAAAADLGPRRTRTTTQAPSEIGPSSHRAAKPPAALEEEWYVSIDGEQDGPFSLVDAQRWVAGKGFDADLHCWSEGFDDWLPVDKVSHFRGLRKKPVQPTPPPIPRAATAAGGLRASAPVSEETPKPLFAATMASLEKSAATPSPATTGAAGLGIPSLNVPQRPSATPPGGERAIAKGSASDSGKVEPKPFKAESKPAKVESKPAKVESKPAKVESKPAKAESKPAKSGKAETKTNGAAIKPAAAKDVFETADQPTQIDSAPFDDSDATVARAESARSLIGDTTGATTARGAEALRAESEVTDAEQKRAASAPLHGDDDDEEDEDLAIGEVSRVVNLADLLAGGRAKTAAPVQRRTSAAPGAAALAANRTGSVPRVSGTGMVPRIDDPNAPAATPDAPVEGADHAIAPAVQETHRRGLIILIGVAGLLLAGVIVAVIMLVGGGSGGLSGLGRTGGIDTTRPDDPLRKGPESGSGAAPVNPYLPPQPKQPIYRPKNPTNPIIPTQPDEPGGNRIGGDEVEAMARAQQGTTQRCYMRAQRGAEQILVGDIKKINVTLDIGADGVVKSVGLDKAAESGLGKCLQAAIRAWKFRASPGGTYRFALVFSAT